MSDEKNTKKKGTEPLSGQALLDHVTATLKENERAVLNDSGFVEISR